MILLILSTTIVILAFIKSFLKNTTKQLSRDTKGRFVGKTASLRSADWMQVADNKFVRI